MTWTHAALLGRRRSVYATGNRAAGEPAIPNRTRPHVRLGWRKQHIHRRPSLSVCAISLAQLGKFVRQPDDMASSGSIEELLNQGSFDPLPDMNPPRAQRRIWISGLLVALHYY